MSAYYKMDPSDWDFRTSSLSLEEEAALLRIINAIHKHDQPVPNNDRVLAGLFRCSTRKAKALLNALVEAGELRIEDGRITNDKAISDIIQRGSVSGSRSESGAKGGRKRADNAAKSLSDNESGQAIASSRIEENRIDTPEANASGHDVPEEPAEDFAKQVFDRAVAFLGRHGVKDQQARSFVGKLRKDGHADGAIFEAFAKCAKEGIVAPIPWITKALGASSQAHQPAITDNVVRIVMENMERRDQQRAAR